MTSLWRNQHNDELFLGKFIKGALYVRINGYDTSWFFLVNNQSRWDYWCEIDE